MFAGTTGDEYFNLLIEENAVDSFADAEINLDFSGIGTGFSVTIDAWVATKEQLGTRGFMIDTGALILDACDQGSDDADTTNVDETRECDVGNGQLAFAGGDNQDMLFPVLNAMSSQAVVLTSLGNAYHSDQNDDDDGRT